MAVHDALLVLGNGRPMLRVVVGMAMSDMFADVGLDSSGTLMLGKVGMGKLSDTPYCSALSSTTTTKDVPVHSAHVPPLCITRPGPAQQLRARLRCKTG